MVDSTTFDWRRAKAPRFTPVAFGAGTELPHAPPPASLEDWLIRRGRYCTNIAELLGGFAGQLVNEGVPIERSALFLRTLHPRILATAYTWRVEDHHVSIVERGHGTQRGDAFLDSPIKPIFEGAPGVRRRLADPDCPRDFPILKDFDEEGATDYLVLPVPFSDGKRYAISYTTRRHGGFDDAHLERLVAVTPTLALVVEAFLVREIAANLVDTYLGHKTGERVLDGQIERGASETIRAAIWFSDLRGFTAMSERLRPPVLLDLLNDHFEQVVIAVEAQGGEVLKFIGDAMLAIFPLSDYGDTAAACGAALGAATDALSRTAARNAARTRAFQPPINFGVALHLGEVSYGNIGSPDRLDFTVIGPAVNHAERIESQCRRMDRQLLTSATFAAVVRQPLDSVGSTL